VLCLDQTLCKWPTTQVSEIQQALNLTCFHITYARLDNICLKHLQHLSCVELHVRHTFNVDAFNLDHGQWTHNIN